MADDTGPTPWKRRGAEPSGPSDDATVAHPPLAAPASTPDAPTVADERATPTPPTATGAPSPPPRKRTKGGGVDALTAVAIGGVVVLAVAILVAVAALNARDGDSTTDGTTTSTTSASQVASDPEAPSSSDAATSSGPDATTTVPVDPPTLADLGADLRCTDLAEAGASYAQAVVYWSTRGANALLDADGDGIPCETTYPSADVALLWGESDDPTVSEGLADGLFCRDLVAQDITYADAAGYWAAQGQPERMDDDGNGIPCETTYPAADVEAFWG